MKAGLFKTMRAVPAAILLVAGANMAQGETVHLLAAGSLKRALSDVAKLYEAASGDRVETRFGASGLLRRRIEAGETADVFASANMKHPQALVDRGRGTRVVPFARNRLCAIAKGGLDVAAAGLLGTMLKPGIRLGTSTPGADPSGDYAWELFGKADRVKPGAFATLDAKALKLTGGPDSAKAPDGRNQYGWVMAAGKADIFLTYCTNAVLARAEVPDLQIVPVPPALAVGADYGLVVLTGAPPAAQALADYIVSGEGRKVLNGYGFETGSP